jgi:hypothetical protein
MIMSSLYAQLALAGRAARIAKILHHGGYAPVFTALEAGTATISWYRVPSGAHITAAKAVLVATGTQAFTKPGRTTLTIGLTTKGRELLEQATNVQLRRLKLTAKGTFTPLGGAAVSAERTVRLRR